MSNFLNKKCIPCEGGTPALTIIEENKYLSQTPSWELNRESIHKLKHEFKFVDFKEAMLFVNQIAEIAEKEGHHPDIYIYYNRVRIELYTHAVKGLFINDFIIAAKIDAVLADFKKE